MFEKKIIQKLATKYNLPLKTVEDIVYFQFKYVADVMELGDFQSIRLPYFGKFHAKPLRIDHINDKTRRKKLKEDNERPADDIK